MSEIVINHPVCVTPVDSLLYVKKLLYSDGYCHLPVVREGEVVGVITREDLSSRYLKSMDQNTLELEDSQISVEMIMNSEPVILDETSSLNDVLDAFLSYDIEGLLIVDQNKKLSGLITKFDLLDHLLAA